MSKTLVFIPTYNEKDNVRPLLDRILATQEALDILFLDDNSPDGTGDIMDALAKTHPQVNVIHRTGKLGIGSAHKHGITWASTHGYTHLVTMDADFTHSPEDIPKLLKASENADVVIASRYLQEDSLKGWNLIRKLLTRTAHVLTRVLLGLQHDSTGAFRLYRLDRVPVGDFLKAVRSNGYSFFFESLYVLHRNRFRLTEIPVSLPPRTYGSSKMSYIEMFKSIRLLLTLWSEGLFRHDRLLPGVRALKESEC